MYQRLLSALQSLEPSLRIEEGKRSSCDIIEVVKYFLEKIDPLLEHKTDREGKNALNIEVDIFSSKLRILCGSSQATDMEGEIVKHATTDVTEGEVLSLPAAQEEVVSSSNISLVCAARVLIEKVFIESTYRSARVGICAVPGSRKAVGISIDAVEELDRNTLDKIDKIVNDKFHVTYRLGRNSKMFLMREAADTKEAGNCNQATSGNEVATDPNAYWRNVKSGSQIVGGTMSMMLLWNNMDSSCVGPSTVALMTAAHVLSREFNCTFYERSKFRTDGTETFCDLTFLDIGDVSNDVIEQFNSVPDLDNLGMNIVITKSIREVLRDLRKETEPEISQFLIGKDVFLNGRLNKSKAIVSEIVHDRRSVPEGKAEVGDSGGLIYDESGVAIAVLKLVNVVDGSYGNATLLTELLPNFQVP
eukprot:gene31179-40537_t